MNWLNSPRLATPNATDVLPAGDNQACNKPRTISQINELSLKMSDLGINEAQICSPDEQAIEEVKRSIVITESNKTDYQEQEDVLPDIHSFKLTNRYRDYFRKESQESNTQYKLNQNIGKPSSKYCSNPSLLKLTSQSQHEMKVQSSDIFTDKKQNENFTTYSRKSVFSNHSRPCEEEVQHILVSIYKIRALPDRPQKEGTPSDSYAIFITHREQEQQFIR